MYKKFIVNKLLPQRSLRQTQIFLASAFHHGLAFRDLKIYHPNYPFLTLFQVHNLYNFPKETLCFLWFVFQVYEIPLIFKMSLNFLLFLQCQLNPLCLPLRSISSNSLTSFIPQILDDLIPIRIGYTCFCYI